MFPIARFRVQDESMRPSLEPGDYVLVNRWAYRRRLPAPGDLVVLRDPTDASRVLVKRIASAAPDGIVVRGDNEPQSRDSRAFGRIPRHLIIGRVWKRIRP